MTTYFLAQIPFFVKISAKLQKNVFKAFFSFSVTKG